MATDTRIPKAEITGLYGAMVRRFSKKMLGDVPEPVGVYWQTPRCSGSISASVRSPRNGTSATRT